MQAKIATLNLCLGLKNKKDVVKRLLVDNNIDICCLQETEIDILYPINILSFSGYNYESEVNSIKARTGIYIKNNVSYKRRNDLEGVDSHMIIVDIICMNRYRIINIYRSFNPQNGKSAKENFCYQLSLIKRAFNQNTVILGDFNLDCNKQFDIDYTHRLLFAEFDAHLSDLNLIQMVEFDTWSRHVGNNFKSSLLDHIYTSEPTNITDIHYVIPPFGDHVMVLCKLKTQLKNVSYTLKRDWRHYTTELLCGRLSNEDWSVNNDCIQEYWNCIENRLINIVDDIVPLVSFKNNCVKSVSLPSHIRNKLNRRKRLLKQQKINQTIDKKLCIQALNMEIKVYFMEKKRKQVRNGIIPGNSKSLWAAVNIAKDINIANLPTVMFLDRVEVTKIELPETFAKFFYNKVNNICVNCQINNNVYNGTNRLVAV